MESSNINFQVFYPLMFGKNSLSQQPMMAEAATAQVTIDMEQTNESSRLLQTQKTSTSSLQSKRGDKLTSGERIRFSQLPPGNNDRQELNKNRVEFEKAQLQLYVALCKVMDDIANDLYVYTL